MGQAPEETSRRRPLSLGLWGGGCRGPRRRRSRPRTALWLQPLPGPVGVLCGGPGAGLTEPHSPERQPVSPKGPFSLEGFSPTRWMNLAWLGWFQGRALPTVITCQEHPAEPSVLRLLAQPGAWSTQWPC